MTFDNPYQSPQTVTTAKAVPPVGGLWQSGKLLVMRKDAQLPDRCVKSNEPATRRLKRSLAWHHPAVYFGLLVNILLYAILAMCMQKRATIHIALTDDWFSRRRRAMLIGWGSVLFSIGLFVLCAIKVGDDSAFGWGLLLGGVMFFVGAIYGLFASRMVAASKIDDTHIWLKGVNRQVLADLPVWQG